MLPELFNPKQLDNLFTTAEFYMQYFDIRKKEQIREILSRVYGSDLKDKQRLNLAIVIFFMLVGLKKESKVSYHALENPGNEEEPYVISTSSMIQLENQFNELME